MKEENIRSKLTMLVDEAIEAQKHLGDAEDNLSRTLNEIGYLLEEATVSKCFRRGCWIGWDDHNDKIVVKLADAINLD